VTWSLGYGTHRKSLPVGPWTGVRVQDTRITTCNMPYFVAIVLSSGGSSATKIESEVQARMQAPQSIEPSERVRAERLFRS